VPIVGVAWFGTDQSFTSFVDRHGLTFPNLDDSPGSVFARFEVPGQPAWAFVAADGSVTTRLGALDEATLDSLLESTLTAAGDGAAS
jgi:hypothetical protein